jgi:hypothetical protein
MSIRTIIFCDDCGQTYEGETMTIGELRKASGTWGWSRVTNRAEGTRKDLCPDCTEARRRQQRAGRKARTT